MRWILRLYSIMLFAFGLLMAVNVAASIGDEAIGTPVLSIMWAVGPIGVGVFAWGRSVAYNRNGLVLITGSLLVLLGLVGAGLVVDDALAGNSKDVLIGAVLVTGATLIGSWLTRLGARGRAE